MKVPPWIKATHSPRDNEVVKLLRSLSLHTICEEARCPNIGECFGRGTATLLILGCICTRNCRFCAVKKGNPLPPDDGEPQRVREVVKELGLRYVVITSPSRDDLRDGGATYFASTIRAVKDIADVEVLVPDFGGSKDALKTVLDEGPYVLNHNVETVPRLYPAIRPMADYDRSLKLLERAKGMGPTTKSGFMVGLGEEMDEVIGLMSDLRDVGVDIVTVGQYIRPPGGKVKVVRYPPLEEFDDIKTIAKELGFKGVASGPLVRSSYRARELAVCSKESLPHPPL
ncbi:lipoyl synthase [candidate division WOR-3 bacterium JGI_Cruoil_03_44_89]|uniref:Lipoyl synthase n=1 Tax=candidate division WOR-3 bacterium JGI_Cruoil_03_44_89 TaxID=1973748 RepID=A0A235BUT3_UNCW3|nr:MAG: lipoyl synthase [candidate division WOR-3 bacterium JGI_Cruoil_03_44_89]